MVRLPDQDKTQQETLERQISAHLAADRTYLQQGIQILELANKAYDPGWLTKRIN